MSHGAFSHTTNERTAQTSSAMRRDNDQIRTFLCSRFVNGAGAVSSNGRRIDQNATETNALQESFHLITVSAAGLRYRSAIRNAAARVIITGPRSATWTTTMRAPTSFANRTAYVRPASEQSEKSTGTRMFGKSLLCAGARNS